jgi:hypothetical protein
VTVEPDRQFGLFEVDGSVLRIVLTEERVGPQLLEEVPDGRNEQSRDAPRVVGDREGEGLVGVLWGRGRSLVWVKTMSALAEA